MNCSDMDVVLHVLNVFYVFGKRSNFLSRLYARLKSNLSTGLEHLGKVSVESPTNVTTDTATPVLAVAALT